MQKSFENIAKRHDNAVANFVSAIQQLGGLTEPQARDVLAFYLKEKIAKIDHGIGKVNVKHGAFLERDILRRAVGLKP